MTHFSPGFIVPPSGPPARSYTLFTWGQAGDGGLGNGTATPNVSSPVQIGSLTDWKYVAAHRTGGTTIKTNGTLWTWGEGYSGKLGNGSTADTSSPAQVGALTDWAYVAYPNGTYVSNCAIKTNGTLWTWGLNTYGDLGQGTSGTHLSSPAQVGAGTDWTKHISNGARHFAAVKSGGTMWTWGRGLFGALGNGSVSNTSAPGQVGSQTDWAQVTAGQGITFGIKTTGKAYSWGRNHYGQLGHGGTTAVSSPVQIGSGTDWAKAVTPNGENHAFMLTTTGKLYSMGLNNGGQLGQGDTTNRSSPSQIGSRTDWTDIFVFGATSAAAAKTSSGEVFVWGVNSTGILGLGNTTNYSSPVQLGSAYDGWLAINGNPAIARK